ncbi:MAG: hypothetical protein AB1641_03760 [Thermodesulfobacteriota bacterium]
MPAYVYDEDGRQTAVIVPAELWNSILKKLGKEIEAELAGDETAYLLSSPAMKARLLEAMTSNDVLPWEEVKNELGLLAAGF